MPGLGLDFSGLEALSGVQPWDAIRAGKERDAQRIALLNQYKQNELWQQQQSEAEIQKHLDEVKNLQVMGQDKKAIQAKSDALAEEIQQGIKKSNGNAKKYLATGGDLAVVKYDESLRQSDEVQRGLKNTYFDYVASSAQQSGKVMMPVNVNGKEMSYGEAKQMYNEGKLKDLPLVQFYTEPDGGDPRKEFAETPGNADMTPKAAGRGDVYQYYYNKGKGLSEDKRQHYAATKAQEYAQGVQSGQLTPYQFKATDPGLAEHRRIADKISVAKLALAEQKMKSEGVGTDPFDDYHSGKYGAQMTQPVNAAAYFTAFGQKPPAGVAADATQPIQMKQTPINEPTHKDAEMNYFGLTKHTDTDKDTKEKHDYWNGHIANGDKAISAENMLPYPGNLNDYDYKITNVEGTRTYASPDGQHIKPYALVTVKFPNKGALKDFGGLSGIYGFRHENAASQGDVSGTELKLLLPVPDPQTNQLGVRQFGAKLRSAGKQKTALDDDEYMPETEAPE